MTSNFEAATRQYAEGVVDLFKQAAKLGWDADPLDHQREHLAEQWYELDDDGKWVAEELPTDLYWLSGNEAPSHESSTTPDIDELSYALRDQNGKYLRELALALEEQLGRALTTYLVGRAWTFLCGHGVALPFLRAVVSEPDAHDDFYLPYFIALVHSGALDEARAEVGRLSQNTSPDRRVVMLAFRALDNVSTGCSRSVIEADVADLENAIAVARRRGRFPGTTFSGCRALSAVYRRMGLPEASRQWAIEARRLIPDSLASLALPNRPDSQAAHESTAADLRAVFSDDSVRTSPFAAAA